MVRSYGVSILRANKIIYLFIFISPDFPVFFTGLSIWKMAWCPTPAKQSAIQYLAIAGKVDHESPMKSKQRVAAPGIIQIWDMGVKSNSL